MARNNGNPGGDLSDLFHFITSPITEIVDGYYAEVEAMGGKRWDTSSLIARLR